MNIAKTDWHLENAAELQKEYPYTFYKPSSQLIDNLEIGDTVQLVFHLDQPQEEEPESERMWVDILTINDSNFEGKLSNKPAYIKGLKYGDKINFHADHIINSKIDDPITDPTEKWRKMCIVSNKILYEEVKVGYFTV